MMATFTHSSEKVSSRNDRRGSHPKVVFDEIPLEELGQTEAVEPEKKKKVPRRIIHFINGDTMEEFSTDDEEEEEVTAPQVDPSQLDWLRWFWFWTVLTATKSLAVADYFGEKLAWFFGITQPKYQYVIDEYYQRKAEEEEDERLAREEAEAELAHVETELTGPVSGELSHEHGGEGLTDMNG
ncbi:protein FAM177A1-like [Watersipora subatra]|uniref:protein FAM177A1-like n=1 Tax=Watersipora subatra TaxID=2589382 RepID=UPI00355AE31A